MPHHSSGLAGFTQLLELLTENGFDGMARAIVILQNETMQLDRSAFMKAGRHKRTETTRSLANLCAVPPLRSSA